MEVFSHTHTNKASPFSCSSSRFQERTLTARAGLHTHLGWSLGGEERWDQPGLRHRLPGDCRSRIHYWQPHLNHWAGRNGSSKERSGQSSERQKQSPRRPQTQPAMKLENGTMRSWHCKWERQILCWSLGRNDEKHCLTVTLQDFCLPRFTA